MLNQTQIKYARGRIDEIYRQKQDELQKLESNAHLVRQLDAIKKGKFEIKEVNPDRYGWYRDWPSYVTIKADNLDDTKFKESRQELTRLKTEALDKLILGDEPEAFEALKKLTDYEV